MAGHPPTKGIPGTRRTSWIAAAWLGLSALAAQAATVVQATPQGDVAQVRQVVVRFDQAVVPQGDPRQEAPYALNCQGAVPKGQGRWLDARQWVYDFDQDVGPGVSCQVQPRASWKPAAASASPWTGARAFGFRTGGPAVVGIEPSGGDVEEQQHWLLSLNGPALASSLGGRMWCEVEGLGERIPLLAVTGATRTEVLASQGITKDDPRLLLVRCQRPLPPQAAVRLVWGTGILAAGGGQVATRQAQTFGFRVRPAFEAEFSCEREKAQAPCLPLRPLSIRFSAPVPRALAEDVRIEQDKGPALKPWFDKDDRSETAEVLTFRAPLPENASLRVVLPAKLRDISDRPVANAHAFPLTVRTGGMPPLAKFATAPFGVIELHAEPGQPPLLPLTVRHVEHDLRASSLWADAAGAGLPGKRKTLSQDAEILQWIAKVRAHHETSFTAKALGRPASQWHEWRTDIDEEGREHRTQVPRQIGSRELSLLHGDPRAQALKVPPADPKDPRPFEVVGLPLPGPGYHIVEIESPRLGAALLARPAPMYVRTGVLVTNLGVHFKLGRESSLVWVTTLDKARPVAGADVAISDCRGRRLWQGRTDARGIAAIAQPLEVERHGGEACLVDDGLFVSARKAIADGPYKGRQDLAFTFSDWHKGIEPWRFNVPTRSPSYGDAAPSLRAHTVTDRALFRAGETVSMKHFVRTETSRGLGAVPEARRPLEARLVHMGSGDEITLPLTWAANGTAQSTWAIPAEAKLGAYEIQLLSRANDAEQRDTSGQFRVEAFRLPMIQARLSGPKDTQIAPRELPLSVQMSFLSGGGFGAAPARVSALLKERGVRFAAYDEFSFEPPRAHGGQDEAGDPEADTTGLQAGGRLIADKLPLVTDREGNARVVLPRLPALQRPMSVQAELSFNDPNGEVQTVSADIALWPSQVVLGLKAGAWTSNRGRVKFQALALDTSGRPLANQKIDVVARVNQYTSTRKRIVGGFYSYDSRTEVKELGSVCGGKTDARGLLLCEAEIDTAGEIELVAQASDRAGREARAATTVWITRHGELWFSQDNDDRMDVLPEKKTYEPGETARLQVRMPFREAAVLVTVEREGVIDSRVMTLKGDDPTIELPIPTASSWAPNVFVSVMALRGRVHEVPWYSFFTWGWRTPLAWWHAFWNEGRDYQAPAAMVDLSRPAFKLGVAQLRIGRGPHTLDVQVLPEKPRYTIRQTVRTRVRVTQQGQPVQGEVAFAAVDEALLALADNPSWQLLDGLLQDRAWGVETSTAQNEIVGRRHYGRKAIAPGGGGGHTASRELFDTLLLWRGTVALDARGEAVVDVPLNDSLTSFRLVAIAQGPARTRTPMEAFGTGSATIQVSQDLQMLPGLPPLVRDGDRFDALFTLRNTTAQPMRVHAELQGQVAYAPGVAAGTLPLPPQDVDVPAQGAREVRWTITVPADAQALTWQATATSRAPAAGDRLTVKQTVQAAVPERVWQASLQQLDGRLSLPVQPPTDALAAAGANPPRPRGGVLVGVQPRLSSGLPGLRRYFETYPFVCLEQQVSKAVGLKDASLWATTSRQLGNYLDSDGLALYFPPAAGAQAQGSDRLTAYLLAATHEAGFELPDGPRSQMLDGLSAFVDGRVLRDSWSPPGRPRELDLTVRKLAAIEALSRHGRAEPRMLDALSIAPQQWPTAAVIDWLNILQRLASVPSRAQRLAEAENVLRARLTYAGTTLKFSTEADDFWWWLMDSADANAARLILAVLDRPGWKDELPRLLTGHLGRQRQGAWLTTTANLWGSLALDKFSQRFESTPVAGATVASLGDATVRHDWSAQPAGGAQRLPWPGPQATPLAVQQQGSGKPWVTVQTLAAVPLKAPLGAGYRLQRQVSIVDGDTLKPLPAGPLPRGAVLRVRLTIVAQADMTWVALNDPVPAGATVLGSGLGRDSALATRGERAEGLWPAYVERRFDAWRAYFDWVPKGEHTIEYTVRLNNPGRFLLPPSRIEAMYAPETFGEQPNSPVEVRP